MPVRCASLLILALGLAACQSEDARPADFAARVGDQYLATEELEEALGALPAGVDSVTARAQLIEQWVRNELLAQEAERLGLREQPAVQRALTENERAVLAAALLDRLYETDLAGVPATEVEAYFERHADNFRLREPFVRVRYLRSADRQAAEAAQQQLSGLDVDADSLWPGLVRRYAADSSLSLALALRALPESGLQDAVGPAWQEFRTLAEGRTGPVVEADSQYHVLQVVRRHPVDARPELTWVEDEVRQLLQISARKQDLARRVQQLKSEAEARSELEIRN